MTSKKNSPQIPELPGIPKSTNPENSVNSRNSRYKGGRVLRYATRFRYWRETEGYTVTCVAADCEKRAREYGIDGKYLLTRLYELEQGRFKPPTWLILLLMDIYQLKFPWWEFLEIA